MKLNDSITATYMKASNSIKKKINDALRQVLRKNKVLKRMQTNDENNCFISLKGCKGNFQNSPTVRLINPAKNEFGKISRFILDGINKNIRENLQIKKHLHRFVKNFYSSIKEKLLIKTLKFAESYTDISDEEKRKINH